MTIDWRIMETAPKDQELLLFCVNDYRPKGGEYVEEYEIGWWEEDPMIGNEPTWENDEGSPLNPVRWAPLSRPLDVPAAEAYGQDEKNAAVVHGRPE